MSEHSSEQVQIRSDGCKPESGRWAARRIRWLKAGWPAIALVIVAFASIPWLIGPSCPKQIAIATGGPDGAYFAYANRYRQILAEDGITLEVKSTAGSVENCRLLADQANGISLAIVQGGVQSDETPANLESLASLYLEPVWVFHRGDEPLQRLTDLKGKRIAVGPHGSGTREIALMLLKENNVLPERAADASTMFVDRGGSDAAHALKEGEIDAAFFVISPNSPLVRELLGTDGVRLMSFQRAEAYRRKYPYLSSVTVAEGVLDLQRNLPRQDVVLLAPTANLVARGDLHPALVPLLLKAVHRVHEQGGLLQEPGTFPSLRYVDFPANAGARRYFKSGPNMLYKHLPFAVAAWIDQVKLVLFPLCTLLFPFVKAAPPIYRWRIRSKIYRWYRVLREIDQKVKRADRNADFSVDIARLRMLESELVEVSVPLSYMEEFYNLRLHVAYVIGQLARRDLQDADTMRPAA